MRWATRMATPSKVRPGNYGKRSRNRATRTATTTSATTSAGLFAASRSQSDPDRHRTRAVTRWILTHPDALPEGNRLQLKAVLANCPELTALAEHVRSFARMLTHLQGDHLPTWIEAATATTELPRLRHFAQHLERDLDAVIAGLTQPWNSGVVEDHVNRIKMLKRQMFGRAGFALLRKRVLLAT
ncbi:transposase [Streptomyces mirabilis]|uniref:transposase n=1 Tax=Streptomyces mirabilis TaxID=68239 RepID=UPI003688072F